MGGHLEGVVSLLGRTSNPTRSEGKPVNASARPGRWGLVQ